jgi:hypothetical protein
MRGAVFPLAYIFAAVRFWPKADIAQEEVTGKFRNFYRNVLLGFSRAR